MQSRADTSRWALLCQRAFVATALIGLMLACARGEKLPPLHGVTPFDAHRYMGTWHEIGALPNPFQKNCYGTQAQYSMADGGAVSVHNMCHKGRPDGPLSEVTGKAWRPAGQADSELKVRFFWPFSGDYWVLACDADYHWAVVGQPKRKYLWILAREPVMAEAQYQALLRMLPAWGYAPEDVRRTLR